MARQERVKALCLTGEIADLLPDALGGLECHPNLALKFFAAHTVARGEEKMHGIELRNERRARIVQDFASGRVHVVATIGANERATRCKLVVRCFLLASAALKAGAAETELQDLCDASVIIGEALEKSLDGEFKRCEGALAHA